jgi:hypothetical protein
MSIKIEQAESAINAEFRTWARDRQFESHPRATDGVLFFTYLQRNRPDLLTFRYPGDKWQKVHAWLSNAGLVRD